MVKFIRVSSAQLTSSLDPHHYVRARRYKNTTNITFDGRTQTLDEWAAEKGLNPTTLRSRLNRQTWTVERALSNQKLERCTWDTNWRHRYADKQVTIGEDTLPISWWARIRGLKPQTVFMRLARGCKIEEALTPGKRSPRPYRCGRCGSAGHASPNCDASIYAVAAFLTRRV